MSRLQVLWLPTRDPDAAPFALIVDQVESASSEDVREDRAEALYEFGRDVGAAGVLITSDRVDVHDADLAELEHAPEVTGTAESVWTFAPREKLSAEVAEMVRTHLETRERLLP